MRPYIGIEGPIGVGKTTLAHYLQEALHTELMLEVFAENPFLARFYESPECYALQTQLFFLMNRYHQQERYSHEGGVLVSDYIFAKNDLFARYTLQGEEMALYTEISSTLAGYLLVPSLVVYIKADLDTLMGRIKQRGRDYEQRESMEAYMEKLVDQYEAFFADYKDAPVLKLDTSRIDIVESEEDRNRLIARIIDTFNQTMEDRPTQVPLL